MAQRGGARPGSGRKPGAVAKAKRDLAEMAKDYAAMALKTLADIAETGESEAARVSAANSILDRGHGKPAQAVEVSGKNGGAILFKTIYETK
jgi:hypothetical protein